MRSRLFALLLSAIALIPPPSHSAQHPAPSPPSDLSPAGLAALPRYPAPANFFGMVVRDPFYEWNLSTREVRQDFINAMMDDLQSAGVEWVRFEFHTYCWPKSNPDEQEICRFDVEQADYFIQAAHARGIKVLALIGTDIFRGAENQLWNFNDYPTSQEYCKHTPDDPSNDLGCGLTPYLEQWLTRALEIANHYQGAIDAYEILNEQNRYYGLVAARNERGLSDQDEMDPIRVARLVTKFYRLRRADGDPTPIILGGLHPFDSSQSDCRGCTVEGYIKKIYESQNEFVAYKNATGSWPIDGVAYHPYPREIPERLESDNDFLYRVPGALRNVLSTIRNYDTRSKLWITEIGTRGNIGDPIDLERQAEFLRIFYQIAWYMRDDIFTVMWFKQEG